MSDGLELLWSPALAGFPPSQELLAVAGDHLWQSTLFAAVAALVAVALRRQSAAVRYWVWFAASVKFLVPVAALVALGGYTSWRSVDVVPYREAPVLIETVGQPFSRDTVTVNTPRAKRAVAAAESRLPSALLAIWGIGAAIFLTRSLLQWRTVQRVARAGVVLEDGREVRIRGRSKQGPASLARCHSWRLTRRSSLGCSASCVHGCCGLVRSANA